MGVEDVVADGANVMDAFVGVDVQDIVVAGPDVIDDVEDEEVINADAPTELTTTEVIVSFVVAGITDCTGCTAG